LMLQNRIYWAGAASSLRLQPEFTGPSSTGGTI